MKFLYQFYKFVLLIGGLSAAVSASAQTPASSKNLGEVVVSASRSEKKLSEVGKVVTILDSATIARAQGQTLPELLGRVVGITASGAANDLGTNVNLIVRGAKTGNVLILIDGVPLNDASDLSNSFDINSIPLDQIDHIEILKGGNSTLYGSDAVAGVINIIRKKASAKAVQLNGLLSAGSYNTFKQSLGVNGTVNNFNYAINASNLSSGGFSVAKDSIGNQGFDKDAYHQQAENVRLGYTFSNKFSISGWLQSTQSKGGLDGGAFADQKDYTYTNNYKLYGVQGNYYLPQGKLSLLLTHNKVERDYLYTPEKLENYTDGNYQGNVFNSQLIFTNAFTNWLSITSGLDFKATNTDQYYYSSSYSSKLSADSAKTNYYSAYASLFYKNNWGLRFELGGRINHDNAYGTAATYTINPAFVLNDRMKLTVNLSSAYKIPSLYELYSEYGKADLQPEKTKSYEAGIETYSADNNWKIGINGFIRNTKDLITFYTDPQTYASQYINADQQKDRGFEAELTGTPGKLNININYAFVEGYAKDEEGKISRNLYRVPKHTINAKVGYNFTKAFYAEANYQFVDKRPETYYDANFTEQETVLPAYSLLGFYAQYQFKHFSLFTDFNNITDTDYTQWLGYNTKGFNYDVGLKLNF